MVFTGVIAVAAVAGLCLLAFIGSRYWPFSEKSVLQSLAEASDSVVTVQGFHGKYFPFPGCVLEGVTFRHGSQGKTLITIDRVRVRGSYLGMLARHISNITAEGAHVFIQPFGSNEPFNTTPSKITVEEFDANGATIDFLSDTAGKPLRFEVHQARLGNVRANGPFSYQASLRNPEPPGELSVKGKFGAWAAGDAGKTPVSGEYSFEQADLGFYEGIAGTLSSKGKFSGQLQHIGIAGDTDIPDFQVKSAGHKVHLVTNFDAYVDGTRGDTFLNHVDVRWGKTNVTVQGSIAGAQGKQGKVALLNLNARQGRIEDILGLFVQAPRSPMSGTVAIAAKAEIPGGDASFLRRVKLQSTFGVNDGSFTNGDTQNNVDKLSAGARGENNDKNNNNKDDPETVLTDIRGSGALILGVAHLSDLSFHIPGAAARMHGTYNVLNYKIDLHGRLRVDTEISKTTTGAKALLLKAMNPFFKHKKKGEVVPVHIGGNYDHPEFGLDVDPGSKGRQK